MGTSVKEDFRAVQEIKTNGINAPIHAAQLQELHKDVYIRNTVTRDSCSQWKEIGISSHSAYLSSDLGPKLVVLFEYFKLHRKNIAIGNSQGALKNKAWERNQLLQECKHHRRGEGQVHQQDKLTNTGHK